MANGKILRQLIKAGSSGDTNEFRRASEAVIANERQKQHHLLANDLEQILYGRSVDSSNSRERGALPEPPVDKERGLPLLDIRLSQRSLEEIVLDKKSKEAIDELILEHRRSDVLRSYGLKPSDKVIFFGPPGCGKTLGAEVLAFELDRPLAVVRLDGMVSSFLGETSANLRKVFEFVAGYPMVVLFDEFDAIGKQRVDSNEHGELRRVVNSVLQMMDAYQGESLILAATNHEHILDSAVWRRFDEAIEFPKPSSEQIHKILALKLRGVRREFDLEELSLQDVLGGYTGAEIERIVRRAVKKMILRSQEFLTIKDLKQAVLRESRNVSN